MTLMIRRGSLLVLLAIATVAAIGPSIVGFAVVRAAVGLSSDEAKTAAERVLFVGIVAATVVGVTLFGMLARLHQLSVTLTRLADLNRVGGHEFVPTLRRLGEVGESILQLYEQTIDLSERKTMRISAMDSLLSVLVARSPRSILIVDPAGKIVRATPAALQFLDTSTANVVGAEIDGVISGVNFARVRAAIGRSPDPWAAEDPPFPVAVQAALNNEGEPGYYVCFLGQDARAIVKAQTRTEKEDLPTRRIAPPPDTSSARRASGRPARFGTRLRAFLRGERSR
jgi:PAS domain-containing protein